MLVDGCTFKGNEAARSGGALLQKFRFLAAEFPVVGVKNSVFVGNRAASGGAVAVDRSQGAVVLQNITAHDNVAHTVG